MSTATAEPTLSTMVTFHCHDFGHWTLPALHEIEGVTELLTSGRAADILMMDGVPAKLMDAMKGKAAHDAARFFLMWVHAGFDFEAAAWSQYLSLHRTLFVDTDEPAPGDELDDDIVVGEGLRLASELDDRADPITNKIVANWTIMR